MPTSCAYSHPGLKRPYQEDNCYRDDALGVYLVCNGIGGHGGGDIASRIACDSVQEFCAHQRVYMPEHPAQALLVAHQRIQQEAAQREEARKMGTTGVFAWVVGNMYHVAWVGDSRAYRVTLENGSAHLEQLTRDHNYAEQLIDEGISPASAYRSAMAHTLVQSLGGGAVEEPVIGSVRGRLTRQQYLLLCSDGLSNELADEEVAVVLASVDFTSAAEALVQRVLTAGRNGAADNVTVMLVRGGN